MTDLFPKFLPSTLGGSANGNHPLGKKLLFWARLESMTEKKRWEKTVNTIGGFPPRFKLGWSHKGRLAIFRVIFYRFPNFWPFEQLQPFLTAILVEQVSLSSRAGSLSAGKLVPVDLRAHSCSGPPGPRLSVQCNLVLWKLPHTRLHTGFLSLAQSWSWVECTKGGDDFFLQSLPFISLPCTPPGPTTWNFLLLL